MIGYLEGVVKAIVPTGAIISAGGVGYRVACTKDTLASLNLNSPASLWTHLAVRENALDLYGFKTDAELKTFELLLTVSGIGPKSALSILDIATISTLKTAIAQGNSSYLTNVSGIGKKTAEKIILELKDKVRMEDVTSLQGDEEALQAMRALGYSVAEARAALKRVPKGIESSSERLRAALKSLGNA